MEGNRARGKIERKRGKATYFAKKLLREVMERKMAGEADRGLVC